MLMLAFILSGTSVSTRKWSNPIQGEMDVVAPQEYPADRTGSLLITENRQPVYLGEEAE
jgi:hypothetical protein